MAKQEQSLPAYLVKLSGCFCLMVSAVLPWCLHQALYGLFFLFHNGQAWFRSKIPNEQSLLQTSGRRALFVTFNDSSRARLYLDLAKEVHDVSAAADIEKRSQHED